MKYQLKKFVFLLLLLPIANRIEAQNSKEAKELYLKGVEMLKDTTYRQLDSGISCIMQAAMLEAQYDRPEGKFIVNCWSYLAEWYATAPFTYEYLFNSYAWAYAIIYNEEDQAEEMLSRMRNTYDKIREGDHPFVFTAHDTIQRVKDQFIFPVRKILRKNGDTTWLEIWGGKNEGLINGSGPAYTSFLSQTEREGNQYIGKAYTLKISNTFSEIMLVHYRSSDTARITEVLPDDRIELPVMVPQKAYKGLLYELASLGVYFNNNSREAFYYPAMIQAMEKLYMEEEILRQFIKSVHETAGWIKEDEELMKSFSDVMVNDGPLGQINLIDAMIKSNLHDMRAFLRFVESYPAKYINRNYKINETFATWQLNNSHPADTVDAYYMERLLQISDSAELWDFFKYHQWYMLQNEGAEEVDPQSMGYGSQQMYKASLHNDYVRSLYNNPMRKKDAFRLLERLKELAVFWGNDTVRSLYLVQEGLMVHQEEGAEAAIKRYDEVILLGVLAWQGYWFKANILSESDETAALRAYEKVNEAAPWFASAWGNRGWQLLKSGKPKPALEICRKAWELAPEEMPWNVNLGHAYLLLNQPDSARMMYRNTLELLSSTAEFEQGPKADFELFISNGMNEDAMRREWAFMLKEWEEHYQFKTKAKERHAEGKLLSEEGRYTEADRLFSEAIGLEKKGRTVDYVQLRTYFRWKAYNLYRAKQYDSSLAAYLNALELAHNYTKSETHITQDLEDVANLYGWLDNKVSESMVRHQLKMMDRKKKETLQSGTLHVLSIGVNSHPGGQYRQAEEDARKIAVLFQKLNTWRYNEVDLHVLTGVNASEDSVSAHLSRIIRQSRSEDAFVFYYAGFASKKAPWLQLGKGDSLTASAFIGKLDYMPGSQKFLFLDADHGPFLDQLMDQLRQKSDNPLLNNDLMLMAPAYYRTEDAVSGASFLTGSLLEALYGEQAASANNAWITTKEVEGRLFALCGREGSYNAMISYSYGLDFVLGYEERKAKGLDQNKPVIKFFNDENSRGGKANAIQGSQTNMVRIQGVVLDDSDLEIVKTSDGQNIVLDNQGRFNVEIKCPESGEITLIARDVHGNEQKEALSVLQACKSSQVPNRKPMNFALLIGINDYEDEGWKDLVNPINDVNAIAQTLKEQYGFQTTLRYNLSKRELFMVLDTFLKRTYLPQDQLLVFVAGHGMYDPNYGGSLVCRDSKKDDPTFYDYFKYSDLVMPFAGNQNLKNVLIVLDVCFGGELFNNNYSRQYLGQSDYDINDAAFIARCKEGMAKQFITSGGKEYVGDGTPGHHSPFATMFLETLKSAGPKKGFLILQDFKNYTGKLPSTPQFGLFARAPFGMPEGEFVFEYIKPKTQKDISF